MIFLASSFLSLLSCQRFNGSFIGLLVGSLAGLLVFIFVPIYLIWVLVIHSLLLPLGLFMSRNAIRDSEIRLILNNMSNRDMAPVGPKQEPWLLWSSGIMPYFIPSHYSVPVDFLMLNFRYRWR